MLLTFSPDDCGTCPVVAVSFDSRAMSMLLVFFPFPSCGFCSPSGIIAKRWLRFTPWANMRIPTGVIGLVMSPLPVRDLVQAEADVVSTVPATLCLPALPPPHPQ